MAAEVSSLRRILNGGDTTAAAASAADHHQTGGKAMIITRDFLGGRSNLLDFKELDLDMHVPSGWEKRLDLKSGKVYVQKKESMISPSSKSSDNKVSSSAAATGAMTKLQDLNFPPTTTITTPKPPTDDTNTAPLNLNLVLFPLSSATSPPPPSSSTAFNSVCTLDKVKFALERAERETNINNNTKQGCRRSISTKRTSSSMSSPSRSSSSVVDNSEILLEEERSRTFATGCPNCLIYVLVSRKDPKCPRCSSLVPSPPHAPPKKPRIDLNISL